ncbi:hypothetical protein, partial [Macellibacteroides fermentans]|uniref:hypothetical protein n=1 Tax=Macellibacteroides fermentans TaxID=879969 RepID=UPI002C277D84|nr:hypothetical protein [Macellibacteroides fermentans]
VAVFSYMIPGIPTIARKKKSYTSDISLWQSASARGSVRFDGGNSKSWTIKQRNNKRQRQFLTFNQKVL